MITFTVAFILLWRRAMWAVLLMAKSLRMAGLIR